METTFKPCSNKKLNEYTKIQLKIYQRYFDIKQDLIAVIKRFDGKVINQRFITALEKVSPKFSCEYISGEITEFVFSFTHYNCELSIHFRGTIGDQILVYKTNYVNNITIYGTDGMRDAHLYGNRLNANMYIPLVEKMFLNLENRMKELIDRVENYDRVASIYKQAYDLLGSVKEYRSICHYSDLKNEPYLYVLKDVLIWK